MSSRDMRDFKFDPHLRACMSVSKKKKSKYEMQILKPIVIGPELIIQLAQSICISLISTQQTRI